MPVKLSPSSGTRFHSLQATSHALQPMHTDVSVKNPIRTGSIEGGTSDLRPRLLRDACATLVVLDQTDELRSAWPASRPDVARHRLDLLDVHIGVERQV